MWQALACKQCNILKLKLQVYCYTGNFHFWGHVRLSWPASLHNPHTRFLLARGAWSLSTGAGEHSLLAPGLGQSGRGHTCTASLSSSGQNGLICSYRYHWRASLNPLGEITVDRSSLSGDHGSRRRSILTSFVSLRSWTNTDPGWDDVTLKWWYLLSPWSSSSLKWGNRSSHTCRLVLWCFRLAPTLAEQSCSLPNCQWPPRCRDLCPMILPLEKPKTPVRCELCVANWEKGDFDLTVPVSKHPPY